MFIFSDENIKALLGKNNYDPNPTTRKEKKQRLAHIESFVLEIGTEGLQSLTILPRYALNTSCQRLVVGSNWYKFFLPEVEKGKEGNTVNSLVTIAKYLYDIFRNKPTIHPKLQYFLDDEVTDLAIVMQLNANLANILPTAEAELRVFPADIIWKNYGTSPKFSYGGNKNMRNLFAALKDQKITLEDSLVSIQKRKTPSLLQGMMMLGKKPIQDAKKRNKPARNMIALLCSPNLKPPIPNQRILMTFMYGKDSTKLKPSWRV